METQPSLRQQLELWDGVLEQIQDQLTEFLCHHEMGKADDFRDRLRRAQNWRNTTGATQH